MIPLLLLLLAGSAQAVDRHDWLREGGTEPMALMGGDTPSVYSVSCASATAPNTATQLRAAVTNRSRRKICFQNQGSVTVAIGSSTVSSSNLFNLGESTNSATAPLYCTNSSGAFYCAAKALATAQTVIVLEETQSIP